MDQLPVKIVLKFQDSPDEGLEVAAAFSKRPHLVYDALLEAVRHVHLQSTDITLLRIESAFYSALKQPWKESKHLRPVLEACRQGKLQSRTERLFFEHGQEYGIVALSVATTPDHHRLLREIDELPDDELIKLAKNIQKTPKRAVLVEFIENFVNSPQGVVSDPTPHLPRPRTRKREIPLNPPPTKLSSSNINQPSKRRRLGSVSDNIAQASPQDQSGLPSANDGTLSPPSTFQLQPVLGDYQSHSAQHANIQQHSGQEERWVVPQTSESQIISLEGVWELTEGEFTQGRPRTYDPGQSLWELMEGEFTQGRPYRYDPKPPPIGQGVFPGQQTMQVQSDGYDTQSTEV